MRRALLGLPLAALAGLLVAFGSSLGTVLPTVALLGVLLGAAVALVPTRSYAAAAGSLLAGIGLAWVSYAVRAVALPDVAVARGLVAAGLVLVLVALGAAMRDRLPLPGLLIGAAATVGAYEATYRIDPTALLTESPMAVLAVTLAAVLGLTVTRLLLPATAPAVAPVAAPVADDAPAEDAPAADAPTEIASMDELFADDRTPVAAR